MLAKLSLAASPIGIGAPQYKELRAKIAVPAPSSTISQNSGRIKLLP
jgi:hypothetical protein